MLFSLTGCWIGHSSMRTHTPADIAGNNIILPVTSYEIDYVTNKFITPNYKAYRTSAGTSHAGVYFNQNGILTAAPTNYLVKSEDFGIFSWSKSNVTVDDEALASPGLDTTADRIIEDATNTVHEVTQTTGATFQTGTTYTLSVYVKADQRNRLRLTLDGGAFSTFSADFNLLTGTSYNPVGSPDAVAIEALDNDWFRVSLTATANATATADVTLSLLDGSGANSYLGNTSEGIYLWGAQLENSDTPTSQIYTDWSIAHGPRFDYDPSSCSGTCAYRGYLLESSSTTFAHYSEDLSGAEWTPSHSTVSTNLVASPMSVVNADKLIEDSDVGQVHNLSQPVVWFNDTRVYSASIFVKAAGRNHLKIKMIRGTDTAESFFNLTTGQTQCTTSAGNATHTSALIQALPNGWYRVQLNSEITTAGGVGTVEFSIGNSSCNDNYNGDGTSGLYLWGYQLEMRSRSSSYIPSLSNSNTDRNSDFFESRSIADWYTSGEGTMATEFIIGNDSQYDLWHWPVTARLTNGADKIELQSSRTNPGIYVEQGALQYGHGFNTVNLSVGSITKMSLGFKDNDFHGAAQGTAGPLGTTGTVPTATALSYASSQGWMRKFFYWNRRLSDEEIVEASTP